jgi:AcrR family transcriptional regulator
MSGSGSLRDQQRALTRQRLLEAAGAVFARRGFHGASVEEIAREAGATTGALYSNFAGKEDLFLALFEHSLDQQVREYSQLFAAGETFEAKARSGADRWMEILRERPAYFPLFIEFWAYAVREPKVRTRLAARFRAFREGMARLVADGAAQRGIELNHEQSQRLGVMVTALGNGLALEKLVDPDAAPDELFGDLLILIFHGLGALASSQANSAGGRRRSAVRA